MAERDLLLVLVLENPWKIEAEEENEDEDGSPKGFFMPNRLNQFPV